MLWRLTDSESKRIYPAPFANVRFFFGFMRLSYPLGLHRSCTEYDPFAVSAFHWTLGILGIKLLAFFNL